MRKIVNLLRKHFIFDFDYVAILNLAQRCVKIHATFPYLSRWDWGPSFPSMGIYKKISLLILKEPKLQAVKFSPKLQNKKWNIEIEAIFDLPKPNSIFSGSILNVKLRSKNGTIIKEDSLETEITPFENEGL